MGQTTRAFLEGTDQRPDKLQIDKELAALKRLKLSLGEREHRKLFQKAVLARLALIDAVRRNEEMYQNADEQPAKDAKVTERFRRRANRVRKFVEDMQEPMPENLASAVAQRLRSWPPPFGWSSFPCSELLRYAEACDRAAAFFVAKSAKSRHSADPQSAHIVELLNFVRLYTGKAHLKELATLLKRPCADIGMNAHRLGQLLRDRTDKDKYPEVSQEAEKAKAGIGALLAQQILSKPAI